VFLRKKKKGGARQQPRKGKEISSLLERGRWRLFLHLLTLILGGRRGEGRGTRLEDVVLSSYFLNSKRERGGGGGDRRKGIAICLNFLILTGGERGEGGRRRISRKL